LRHSERLFIDRILLAPARHHRERSREIGAASLSADAIEREYRRLASLFLVEFDSFERKRYVNLSHAPNKAMNLNSYIALVGKDWREVSRPEGVHLESCEDGAATLQVPAAEYIVTVDADSLVTFDYATRLVGVLERPDNARVAIAQTPYTAVPEPPVAIERAASASTDAQFFNHQGMAWLGAPFWVGASALMRHAALEDIATEREERGHRIRVYIDDTILIEDAAATIDLLDRGWQVHHDAGRLSYSATPADFGALVIQRRRWANGGLLILPRLLRHAFRRPWSSARLVDATLRIPNLISASIAGIGLPIVLLYRFDDSLLPLWIPPLLAGPYCLLYGRDLTRAGYRWSDLPRVFALNLLLIPVNFAGTSQSLRQAFTGRAIPFQRTPKVAGRTRTPLAYLCALYGFCVFAAITAAVDLVTGRYEHILFPLIAGTATAYGIATFVGLAHSRDDLLARLRAIRARRARALVPGRRSQEGAVR
jgi:cellulose synthase/poly-beta-1,6-N-acetylglucosamine synthase-like glycosyltransferase